MIVDLGLRYEDSYKLSLGEYNLLLKSHQKRRDHEYNQTRMLMFELRCGNPHMDKKHKPKKPSDLFELPTVDIESREPATETLISDEQAKKDEVLFGYKINNAFIEHGHTQQIKS